MEACPSKETSSHLGPLLHYILIEQCLYDGILTKLAGIALKSQKKKYAGNQLAANPCETNIRDTLLTMTATTLP